MMSITDKQIGGNHYIEFKIQPIDFILNNNLSFCQGNVIKYICRYKYKNHIEDLDKAIHYIEIMKKEEEKKKRKRKKYNKKPSN